MPLGLDWLVDVRDYFVEAPAAMCVAALALHVIFSKMGYYRNLDKKEEYEDF